MNPLLQLVLSLSLGGSLMALLVLGLKWTLRGKLPSAFFYCAWLAVLLRLVLPLPGFMNLDSREEAAPAAVYDTTADTAEIININTPVDTHTGIFIRLCNRRFLCLYSSLFMCFTLPQCFFCFFS